MLIILGEKELYFNIHRKLEKELYLKREMMVYITEEFNTSSNREIQLKKIWLLSPRRQKEKNE